MRVPSSSSFPFTKVPSSDLVLFVETDVSRTVLHKKHLLAKGYRIFQAKNCVEAFNIIDKAAVKVIVLDLNLKDNQAFEFLQGLKKKGTAASVIAITSRTSSKAALRRSVLAPVIFCSARLRPINSVRL